MPNALDMHSKRVARNVVASTSRVVVANLNVDSHNQWTRTHIATRAMH
jgi:hypothetical protein